MGCSKSRCPIQYNTLIDCNLSKDECPMYTEEIDYKLLYENMCNHIADLVIKKLKENNQLNNFKNTEE